MSFSTYRNGIAALALLVGMSAARAQTAKPEAAPAGTNVSSAQQAYNDGTEAYRAGKFDEAVHKFEEAYRVLKFPNMLFEIAQSYRRLYETSKDLEHLRKSLDLYRSYLNQASATASQRPVALQFIPVLEKTLNDASAERREELVAKATGKDGIFLADQLLVDGSPKDALLVLNRVLSAHRNSRDVMLAGYSKRALVLIKLGQRAAAVEDFKRTRAIDSKFVLPQNADAATVGAFETAKRAFPATEHLSISIIPPRGIEAEHPLIIPVKVDADPLHMVTDCAVFYRKAAHDSFMFAKSGPEHTTVTVPQSFIAALGPGESLEFYVSALDQNDSELTSIGSPQEPILLSMPGLPTGLSLTPTPNPALTAPIAVSPKRWYKKWWVWTLIGVAVAGAATGIGVGVYYAEKPSNPPAFSVTAQ